VTVWQAVRWMEHSNIARVLHGLIVLELSVVRAMHNSERPPIGLRSSRRVAPN
jgi:hypothetical protein